MVIQVLVRIMVFVGKTLNWTATCGVFKPTTSHCQQWMRRLPSAQTSLSSRGVSNNICWIVFDEIYHPLERSYLPCTQDVRLLTPAVAGNGLLFNFTCKQEEKLKNKRLSNRVDTGAENRSNGSFIKFNEEMRRYEKGIVKDISLGQNVAQSLMITWLWICDN